MADHPNVAVVRDYLNAMTSEDMQASANFLSDDVEWHEIGRSDAIHGKAALAERFSGDGLGDVEFTGGSTHDIIANDDHVVALLTADVRKGDKTLTYRVAEIYHVRDGKITARWAFSDDTQEITDFFA